MPDISDEREDISLLSPVACVFYVLIFLISFVTLRRYHRSIRIKSMKRRQFLASGVIVSSFMSLWPAKLLGGWSVESFQQASLEQAFINALGTRDIVRSEALSIVAPPVASDSSAVPVEVHSSLRGDQLYLFVEKNLTPLVFKCVLHGGAFPFFSLNIKMKESSALYAVVRDGGKYFMASVQVEVVAQAC